MNGALLKDPFSTKMEVVIFETCLNIYSKRVMGSDTSRSSIGVKWVFKKSTHYFDADPNRGVINGIPDQRAISASIFNGGISTRV